MSPVPKRPLTHLHIFLIHQHSCYTIHWFQWRISWVNDAVLIYLLPVCHLFFCTTCSRPGQLPAVWSSASTLFSCTDAHQYVNTVLAILAFGASPLMSHMAVFSSRANMCVSWDKRERFRMTPGQNSRVGVSKTRSVNKLTLFPEKGQVQHGVSTGQY